ncbi:hypothetical protein Hanom_Chr17g01574651 [Helianthus anomalus]
MRNPNRRPFASENFVVAVAAFCCAPPPSGGGRPFCNTERERYEMSYRRTYR